jgi:hypothetical protein
VFSLRAKKSISRRKNPVSKIKGEKTLASKTTPHECVGSLNCTKHETNLFLAVWLLSQHTPLRFMSKKKKTHASTKRSSRGAKYLTGFWRKLFGSSFFICFVYLFGLSNKYEYDLLKKNFICSTQKNSINIF